MNEQIDLFSDYLNLPKEIIKIIDKFNETSESYINCNGFVKELNNYGYTCDYDMDGNLYELRCIKIENLADLKVGEFYKIKAVTKTRTFFYKAFLVYKNEGLLRFETSIKFDGLAEHPINTAIIVLSIKNGEIEDKENVFLL